MWRQVSAGRAHAPAVPSALHLLLHCTPLLAPGRLVAYAAVLRAAARIAYLGLLEAGSPVPAWRLSHVQQVEVLSHMARLMQGLSARAAEQTDVMPTLATLWADLWDKGLDLVHTMEPVERRAELPPDGTVPNDKIRSLLSHMASTMPAPVLLALMPHALRAPQWLEELARDYFVWEAEEPPRLAALVSALPARMQLPAPDVSHSYPLVLSALFRRASAAAGNVGAAQWNEEVNAWCTIAGKCEPAPHQQLHMLPVWVSLLLIYADQRTAPQPQLFMRLLERYAPAKASFFSRLTSDEPPPDTPQYLAARACMVYVARLTTQKRVRAGAIIEKGGGVVAEEQQLHDKLLACKSESKLFSNARYQAFFNEAESFLSPLCDIPTFASALCTTLFPFAPYLLHACEGAPMASKP